MHQGNDDQPTTHAAGMETVTADALRTFLVPGLATPSNAGSMAMGTAAALAGKLADLAARLALVDPDTVPDAGEFALSVGLQPAMGSEAENVAALDAVAALLLPGMAPHRMLMRNGSTQYRAKGRTPAGLAVSLFAAVTPSGVERAALDAVSVAQAEAEAAQRDRVCRAIEADRLEAQAAQRDRVYRAASALGHVPEFEPAAELTMVRCTCGVFETVPADHGATVAAWLRHAADRIEADR